MTSPEQTYLARTVLIVVETFPKILQQMVLCQQNPMSPGVLHGLIRRDTRFMSQIGKQKMQKASTLLTNGYDLIDCSLMYKFITHFKLVEEPTQGWGKIPDPHALKVGDDVERIRNHRNNIMHKPRAEGVTDTEFNRIFEDVLDISKRVDRLSQLLTHDLENEVGKFKTCMLSIEEQMKYIALLESYIELQEQLAVQVGRHNMVVRFMKDILQSCEDTQQARVSQMLRLVIHMYDCNNDEELVRTFNLLKEEINKDIPNIVLEGAELGTIVLYIKVTTSSLSSKQEFKITLQSFLETICRKKEIDILLPETIDIYVAFDDYDPAEQNTIRIVLLGRTGSGKSATGNTILSRNEFCSDMSPSSITSECKLAECCIDGCSFKVVDTPGIFDTKLKEGQVAKEIIRCIHMSIPGPHAFLLVVKLDRFTKEEIQTFDKMFEIFGEQINSFAIVLFTRLDALGKKTIDKYIGESNVLMELIKKCEGRYISFNNNGNEHQRATYVQKLEQLLDDMIKKNSGKYYTNDMYKEAEAALQKKITEVEIEKSLEKQKEIEQIESKFKKEIFSIKAEKQYLEDEIQKQKHENESVQSQRLKNERIIDQLQKEINEAREAEKKKADIELKKLQNKEDKSRDTILEMQHQIDKTKLKLRNLETEKKKDLEELQLSYEIQMKDALKQMTITNDKTIAFLQQEFAKNQAMANNKIEMLVRRLREKDIFECSIQ